MLVSVIPFFPSVGRRIQQMLCHFMDRADNPLTRDGRVHTDNGFNIT